MKESMKEPKTYKELFAADSVTFLKMINKQIPNLDISEEDGEEITNDSITAATKVLMKSGSVYAYFTALEGWAKILKRQYCREWAAEKDKEEKDKKKVLYEDMVDKEAIISGAKKAVDIQHRTANKVLSIYTEMNRERYLNDSVYAKKKR